MGDGGCGVCIDTVTRLSAMTINAQGQTDFFLNALILPQIIFSQSYVPCFGVIDRKIYTGNLYANME